MPYAFLPEAFFLAGLFVVSPKTPTQSTKQSKAQNATENTNRIKHKIQPDKKHKAKHKTQNTKHNKTQNTTKHKTQQITKHNKKTHTKKNKTEVESVQLGIALSLASNYLRL